MEQDAGIAAYEGLVGKTAEMFSGLVGMEYEDMRQELLIKVVKAKRAFDPTRSKMTERAYVFSCVTNFVKDCKKIASRRSVMRIEYIEEHVVVEDNALNRECLSPAFEYRYLHVTEDEAFHVLDAFAMPATVTRDEAIIVAMLMLGYEQQEVAEFMSVSRTYVAACVKKLREKLADWRPETPPPMPLPVAAPIAA